MERRHLKNATDKLPDLQARWESRLHALEAERQEVWSDLRQLLRKDPDGDAEQVADLDHNMARLDRSISFLDRALLHLDDIEYGTKFAERVPLKPD